jgi:hypothetical protein
VRRPDDLALVRRFGRLGHRFRQSFLAAPNTAAQRLHEVDDIRTFGAVLLSMGDDAPALELVPDQRLQRSRVMVLEFRGIECGSLASDELGSKIHHLLVRLRLRDLAEIVVSIAQFVSVAQHDHDQPVIQRCDCEQPFASADRHLGDARFAGLAHGLANDCIAFSRDRIRRHDVIRSLEVAPVDLGDIDELGNVDRLLALELDRVDLLGLERDVGIGIDLVAFDDVTVLDFAETRHDLLVAYAAPGRLVDLAERDLGLSLHSVVDLDRDRNERKAQEALPVGTCLLRHDAVLECSMGREFDELQR